MVVCRFFQQGYCRYGQSCRFEHIYGTKYSYRASQSQNERIDDTYSSDMRQSSSNNVASSLFRSAAQNISPFSSAPNNSTFQQNPAQSRGSVFDRLGPAQNVSGFQNNQAQSIFAQANQSTFGPPQPTRSVFNNPDPAKSIFAQASQNIFGPAQSVNTFNQPRDTAASIFASAAQNLHNDPFKQQPTSVFNSQQQSVQNVFQISERPTSNVFGVSVAALDQTNDDESLYSKIEELSKSDLEAFESTDFKLGFIPELPPPKSLCV